MQDHHDEYRPDDTGIMAAKNTVRVPFPLLIAVMGIALSGAGWLVNGVTVEIRELNVQFAEYRAVTERRIARLEAQQEMTTRILDDHTRRDLEARSK